MVDGIVRVLQILPSLSPAELRFLFERSCELLGEEFVKSWAKNSRKVARKLPQLSLENSHENQPENGATRQNIPRSSSSSSKEVLQFLNEKASRNYRPIETNLKLIDARLQSGATVQDCKSVIAKKVREWKNDPKMSVFLRPKTLFNSTNFEQYFGELLKETP